MNIPGNYARVGIMHEGNVVQEAYIVGSSYYMTASATAVVQMRPNEVAYCRLLYGRIHGDSYNYLHFVGYLLYALE